MKAAELDTPISALVNGILKQLGATELEFQRRQHEPQARIPANRRVTDVLLREQFHQRRARPETRFQTFR